MNLKQVKFTKQVFDILKDPYERSFYLTLLFFADQDNQVHLSNNELAEYACMSSRKIIELKRLLSEKTIDNVNPLIEVTQIKNNDKSHKASLITLLF